jgi:hypothetical protein
LCGQPVRVTLASPIPPRTLIEGGAMERELKEAAAEVDPM